MTILIMPEFDREGRTVCQFWLQGGKHNEIPTDKKSRLFEPPWGTFGPLFLKGRKEGEANSIKEIEQDTILRG